MGDFIHYFLRVNLAISALYLTYCLLFRMEKFFHLNRVILLAILILPLILPVIPSMVSTHDESWKQPLPGLGNDRRALAPAFEKPIASLELLSLSQQKVHSDTSAALLGNLLVIVYLSVTGFLLARLFYRMFALWRFVRKECVPSQSGEEFACYEHDGNISAFSFFGWVVLNSRQYSQEEFRQIYIHERIHVRQRHSVDLILAELIHAFLWVNPFIPLLKSTMRLNLEYIVDHAVLASGVDKACYQRTLLGRSLSPAAFPVSHFFGSSKLKMRIQMMNTKATSLRRLCKYVLALPVVFLTHFVVSPETRSLHAMAASASRAVVSVQEPVNGYYALEGNFYYVMRIQATTQGLRQRELWSGRETTFEKLSETQYWNSSRGFPLTFVSVDAGIRASLVAFGRDRWVKIEELDSWIKQEFRLTPEQLKAFVGYYQFGNNPDLYLKFSVKEDGLVAKEMWSGNEFFIVPKSALEFYLKTANYPVEFTRNQSGTVTQVMVFKKDVWKKVAEYTPRKVIKLSSDKLQAFEGNYTHQFQPGQNAHIQITAGADHLTLKELWSGNEIRFVPSSELEFFNQQRAFPLKFTKDKTGKIISVLAFNRDVWTKE